MIFRNKAARPSDQSFLSDGGEMGALMRAHDWSASPLGPPEGWPQSLRSALSTCLNSKAVGAIYWGRDFRLLYNDGYRPFLDVRHPWALGHTMAEIWPTMWQSLSVPAQQVFDTGQGVVAENQRLMMERDGGLVESFWYYSFAPIRSETGEVEGIFLTALDTTAQVIAERRVKEAVDAAGLSADFRALFEASPTPFLVVAPPDWTIVAANDARLQVTGMSREAQIGRNLFEVFPDDPADPTADGVRNLTASFERVVANKASDTMAVQRYALRDADGRFVERWWSPVNTPVLDKAGNVALIIHRVEDVTEVVRLRGEADVHDQLSRDQQGVIEQLRVSEAALRESEARNRFRAELGDALRALTSPSEIMAVVAERLGSYLGVDQANYYLIDGDRFTVSEEWRSERSPGLIGSHRIADFGPEARRLMDRQEMLRLDDTRGTDGAEGYAAADMGAVLSAPLHSSGRWTGGFHVHSAVPRGWTDAEAALVRETAERAWAEMERARAEAELRASEEFNRRVLASSADCIKVLDLDGRLEFMSEGGMGVMEVDDFGSIAGPYWPDLWPGGERAKALAAIEQARQGGKGRFQGFAKTMKGSPRWWDVAVTPINGPDGRPEKLLSVSRDVTATRTAEKQLRQLNATLEARVAERTAERNLLATIVETTNTQIQALDRDFRWIAINAANADAYERIYGKRPRVGDSLLELLADTPTEQAAAKALWGRALAGESFIEVSAWGDEAFDRRHYEMRFETLRDADGAPIGAFLTGSDITDRVREQQRLAEAEEALRQSQKMEAMGQLTGGVSHDFNNLLSPIIGGLDLLQRRGVGDERAQRTIAGALQSAERAKTLVQRLLAFARRQPLQPTAIDIGALVAGMAELVESTTGPQVTVAVEVAEGLPPARADAHQVEMALLNLCVNAKDAMEAGGDLTIAAAAESFDDAGNPYGLAAGDYIRLSVADTGIGMDEATLKRAVEPFFTSKGIGKGTGLGLSMVHGLAAQLGGTLDIVSRAGIGTTVRLWLPVSSEPARTGTEAAEIERPASSGIALLVDDEALVRESSADMLSDLGYVVIEAECAASALKLLGDGLRPDVLVTDHLMPGMSGTELALQVRAQRLVPRVLVVSGYAEVGGIPTDIKRLTKPFRGADLAAAIDGLVPTFDQDSAAN